MAISYSSDLKNARMQSVLTAIAGGRVEICDEAYVHVLAVIPLADPAGVLVGDTITFTLPAEDAEADDTGQAVIARIKNNAGAIKVLGLTVGIIGTGFGGGDPDIVVNSAAISEGQKFTLLALTLQHAA